LVLTKKKETKFGAEASLQNFSVTQILREIKVGESRESKTAFLRCLEALNFDLCEFLHFLKAKIKY